MLIQCVEETNLPSVESTPRWRSVATRLRADPWLHASSARYWSCLGDRDLENGFSVSGPMRAIWESIRQAWEGAGGMADR